MRKFYCQVFLDTKKWCDGVRVWFFDENNTVIEVGKIYLTNFLINEVNTINNLLKLIKLPLITEEEITLLKENSKNLYFNSDEELEKIRSHFSSPYV